MSANTMATTRQQPRWLRKHFAIPSEHGAWAMWLGPFAVGLGIARRLNLSILWALLAMLLLFLARQPMIILAKAWSGRRSRDDAFPALIWLAIYGGLAVIPVALLMGLGAPHYFGLRSRHSRHSPGNSGSSPAAPSAR